MTVFPARLRLALLAAVLLGLALAAPAHGGVRSGAVDDPMDNQRQSLTPEYYTDVERVQAAYDEAGSLTVAVTFFLPVALTAATATEALRQRLAARYGQAFTAARHPYAKCPSEEIIGDPDTDPDVYAICRFELSVGRRFRAGSAIVRPGDPGLEVEISGVRTFSKTLVRCARGYVRAQRYANGVRITGRRLRAQSGACRYLPGSAGMVNDISADVARRWPRALPRGYRTYVHGTNQAGFEESAVYPCRCARACDAAGAPTSLPARTSLATASSTASMRHAAEHGRRPGRRGEHSLNA